MHFFVIKKQLKKKNSIFVNSLFLKNFARKKNTLKSQAIINGMGCLRFLALSSFLYTSRLNGLWIQGTIVIQILNNVPGLKEFNWRFNNCLIRQELPEMKVMNSLHCGWKRDQINTKHYVNFVTHLFIDITVMGLSISVCWIG